MRSETINRKYVNKRKVIRDKKKALIVGRQRKEGSKIIDIPLSKKEEKKQERIEKIYKELNIKKNPADKKQIKRRHKKNKSGKYYEIVNDKEEEGMNID